MDIVQKQGRVSGAAKLFIKIKYRWERGRAVLWRRCNQAQLSVTLSNLGFAQVTYPVSRRPMVPEQNEGSIGMSVAHTSILPPQPPLLA